MTQVATVALDRPEAGGRVRRVIRLAGFMQKEAGAMIGLTEVRMSQKIAGRRSGFEYAHLHALATVCVGHDALKHVSVNDLLGYLTGELDEIPGFDNASRKVEAA